MYFLHIPEFLDGFHNTFWSVYSEAIKVSHFLLLPEIASYYFRK